MWENNSIPISEVRNWGLEKWPESSGFKNHYILMLEGCLEFYSQPRTAFFQSSAFLPLLIKANPVSSFVYKSKHWWSITYKQYNIIMMMSKSIIEKTCWYKNTMQSSVYLKEVRCIHMSNMNNILQIWFPCCLELQLHRCLEKKHYCKLSKEVLVC